MKMGYVYLMNIVGTKYYKIGKTKNEINLRKEQLQTAVPTKLQLIASFSSDYYDKIETAMHNFLSHKKYRQDEFDNLLGEWFLLDDYDVNGFSTKCMNIEDNITFLNEHKI